MNLMYLPTKNKLYSDPRVVTLALVAQFITEKTKNKFTDCCQNISFRRLTTRIDDVSSIPPECHQKNIVDAFLLEVNVNSKSDLKQLQVLLETDFKYIPVIVTANEVTLNMTRELMHMGVVDILPQPFTEEDILTVLQRASKNNIRKGTTAANGKLISFIKGGGGVGATTLAVQSGCYLSKKLASHNMDVSLIDLDIQFGTAGLYLDIQNDNGLMAILSASDRIDETLLQGAFNEHEATGLKVLTIPRDVIPMDVISEKVILQTLQILRQHHKFSIVDMPSTWSSWSATVLKHSEMIILVTEVSISAISQAKRQLETLQAQGLGGIPIKVVLNRYSEKMQKMFSISEVEKALGRGIDYKIPNDYKLVCDAENRGVPLMNIAPKSRVDKSIHRMICDVVGDISNPEIKSYLEEPTPTFLERIGLSHVFEK